VSCFRNWNVFDKFSKRRMKILLGDIALVLLAPSKIFPTIWSVKDETHLVEDLRPADFPKDMKMLPVARGLAESAGLRAWLEWAVREPPRRVSCQSTLVSRDGCSARRDAQRASFSTSLQCTLPVSSAIRRAY
jgi:hypothetical protein